MINQATTLQRVRIPVLAIATFALGALASAVAPQLHLGVAAPATTTVITQATAPLARPALTTSRAEATTTCGAGAYVSGDMVGDASPSSVYATMCGR